MLASLPWITRIPYYYFFRLTNLFTTETHKINESIEEEEKTVPNTEHRIRILYATGGETNYYPVMGIQ